MSTYTVLQKYFKTILASVNSTKFTFTKTTLEVRNQKVDIRSLKHFRKVKTCAEIKIPKFHEAVDAACRIARSVKTIVTHSIQIQIYKSLPPKRFHENKFCNIILNDYAVVLFYLSFSLLMCSCLTHLVLKK